VKKKISCAITAYLLGVCLALPALAQHSSGLVNSDDINIRCDSNISSAIIAKLTRGQRVEILLERYDWYKIRLPRYAPAYVKKQFVEITDKQQASINAKFVNIRLGPDDSAAIIGRGETGEPVEVIGESGDWYKIVPVKNSFGWAHKQFITTIAAVKMPDAITAASSTIKPAQNADITCEGILQLNANKRYPYKLVTKDYLIYLVKPPAVENIDDLLYQKIKIIGKSIPKPKEKYPAIEAVKVEPLE